MVILGEEDDQEGLGKQMALKSEEPETLMIARNGIAYIHMLSRSPPT
jgi:hypothetical protein